MAASGYGAADKVTKAGDSMTGTLALTGATPLQVTTTGPAAGKVLVSDASGNASWGDAGGRSVMAFGAKGDGVTDDTVAIQAAINAGGITYFPPGRYLTGRLETKLGTVLVGVEQSNYAYPVPATQSSVLQLKNGANDHLIHGSVGVANVQIRNLGLDGNKANNTSGDLIHIDDDTGGHDTAWHIVDCYLNNAAGDGIYIGTSRQAVKVNRTWIMQAAANGVNIQGSDTGLNTVLIGLAGTNGVLIGAGAWVIRLTDCDIWSSTLAGVDSSAGASMVTLHGCGIDRHKRQGLIVGSGSVTVLGCLFHSNSQQANATYGHIEITGGAVSVIGTIFGYDSLANNPDYAIKPTGSAVVYEWGNRLVSGSTVTGYCSDTSKVTNSVTGNLQLAQTAQINVGGSGSAASFAVLRANQTDPLFSGRITGDTQTRWFADVSGTQQWGGGSATADVALTRSAANTLSLSTADFRIATAGRGLRVAEGTNAKMGVATLAAGTVTVSTTAVTATSRIFLSVQSLGTVTVPAAVGVSAVAAGTSFTIKSSASNDTSVVAWMIVEPA